MQVVINTLEPHHSGRFVELVTIFADVFDMPTLEIPEEAYLKQLLSNPDFIVIVATVDEAVVGGATVYLLHKYYTTKKAAYIYDIGVTPNFQGKGIGKQLIQFIMDYCKQHNIDDAWVEAEADDAAAVNFYRKTPNSGEIHAIHFNYENQINV